MNLDRNGLPTQADGDANDQLQRVAMCAAAYALNPKTLPWLDPCPLDPRNMYLALKLRGRLHPKPGVLVRYEFADPRNCSGDQIVSALAAYVAARMYFEAFLVSMRILMRLGFAQNIHDGLDGKTAKLKVPDFILIRALPLMCRCLTVLWPLALVADLLLVVAGLMSAAPVWRDGKGFTARSSDDVDDNVQLLTFAVCRLCKPTPLSVLGNWLYGKLRPWNLGCRVWVGTGHDSTSHWNKDAYHPVQGALEWYHRTDAGGNIEIAQAWRPITARLYGGTK